MPVNNQLPLFPDADPEPNDDDVYRELLQASWNESIRIITERGEIPPWIEQDALLNADELRVMSLIDESGEGWIEGGHTIVEYDNDTQRRVSPITVAAGFNAEANCVAVINSCIDKGYIKRVVTNTESRLMIDVQGRWRLDAYHDQEAETLQHLPGTTEEGT